MIAIIFDKYHIQIIIIFFTGTAVSEQNEQFSSNALAPNHVCPRWTALQLPQVGHSPPILYTVKSLL